MVFPIRFDRECLHHFVFGLYVMVFSVSIRFDRGHVSCSQREFTKPGDTKKDLAPVQVE